MATEGNFTTVFTVIFTTGSGHDHGQIVAHTAATSHELPLRPFGECISSMQTACCGLAPVLVDLDYSLASIAAADDADQCHGRRRLDLSLRKWGPPNAGVGL